MRITANREEIAKELTLALIEKGEMAGITRGNDSGDEFNQKVGASIGAMYQSILAKVCDVSSIDPQSK